MEGDAPVGCRGICFWWGLGYLTGYLNGYAALGFEEVGEGVGVFGAGETFAVGDFHTVGEDFEAVAVGVGEVEGTAAAAVDVVVAFDAVGGGAVEDWDAVGVEVGEGAHKFVAVGDLEGDLLDEAGAGGDGGGDVDAVGGGGDDEVVVGFVEAEEGGLAAVGTLAVVGDLAAEDFGVEAEGAVEVGDEDAEVPDAFDLDTHIGASLDGSLLVGDSIAE